MNRVRLLGPGFYSALRHVAIYIASVSDEQRHLGIIHGSIDEPVLLELQWHHRLQNAPLCDQPRALFVDPAVDPRRLRQVAAVCRLVWERNRVGGLPYGFSPPNDSFDAATGEFLVGGSRHGLTCASFVLGVFHLARLPLVNYRTWPEGRPDDAQWQEDIIGKLERTGAPKEHIDSLRRDVGCVRYRPEEVAAASVGDTIPADFLDVLKLRAELLAELYGSTSE